MNSIDKIKDHFHSGRYEDCLVLCQQLLESEPSQAFPWKYAGKSFMLLGKLEDAKKCLINARNIDNMDAEIVKDIGNIFYTINNEEEAIKCFKEAIKIDQNYAPALNNLGLILKGHGNLVDAEKLMQSAVEANDAFAPYHMNLGGIYHDLGKLELALASTLRSLELDSNNAKALINAGVIFNRIGNLDQALSYTLKSLKLTPDNSIAYINLSGIYQQLNQLDQALNCTLKAIELNPNDHAMHLRAGCIYKDLNQLDQALKSTLLAIELAPNVSDSYMTLGSIYYSFGNYEDALASTLKSIKVQPDNANAHMNLGLIYKDLGTDYINLALSSTLTSLELMPDNADAYANLGSIYKELGDLENALESSLKSLELEPKNPEEYINLADIYFRKENYLDSKKSIEKAVNYNSKNIILCATIKAACLYELNDYDEALKVLETAFDSKGLTENELSELDISRKAIKFAQDQKSNNMTLVRSDSQKLQISESELVIKAFRPVHNTLINELLEIESKSLSQTRDSRFGNGYCTDFSLLSNLTPEIQRLSNDLEKIISERLLKKACSLKYDSFLNIFNSGSGQPPHTHIKPRDSMFDLAQHKYSLVYYLDPGDQKCEYPGILSLHEPDIQIIPERGMIVLIPATRKHSVVYSGSKTRLMIGVNFYAF